MNLFENLQLMHETNKNIINGIDVQKFTNDLHDILDEWKKDAIATTGLDEDTQYWYNGKPIEGQWPNIADAFNNNDYQHEEFIINDLEEKGYDISKIVDKDIDDALAPPFHEILKDIVIGIYYDLEPSPSDGRYCREYYDSLDMNDNIECPECQEDNIKSKWFDKETEEYYCPECGCEI